MDWFDLTALELGAKIQAGEVSAVDAARACLARIEEKEPTVHASRRRRRWRAQRPCRSASIPAS